MGTKVQFIVTVIESERGWGSSSEEVKFNSYEEAEAYRDRINDQDFSGPTPDWYMIAENEISVRRV